MYAKADIERSKVVYKMFIYDSTNGCASIIFDQDMLKK